MKNSMDKEALLKSITSIIGNELYLSGNQMKKVLDIMVVAFENID